jgi:hypothetical protein
MFFLSFYFTEFESVLMETIEIIKILKVLVREQHTVKPMHNGHPWDLKNMVIMQRVVRKISVVSKLQAGRCGFRLVAIRRWSLRQV